MPSPVEQPDRVRIDFHASAEPTLGVEWELALVDRRTRDLRNDAAHLFARAKARLADPERLHKELLKNTVEIVTGVCPTVPEAMADLRRTLEVVVPAGRRPRPRPVRRGHPPVRVVDRRSSSPRGTATRS